MAFNYARAKKTATRLIKNFGQTGTLHVFSRDLAGDVEYTTVSVLMAVVNYEDRQIDGTRITEQDRLIYVEAKHEITPNDRIEDAAGTLYEVISPVKPINPGGITVVYEVQGRA